MIFWGRASCIRIPYHVLGIGFRHREGWGGGGWVGGLCWGEGKVNAICRCQYFKYRPVYYYTGRYIGIYEETRQDGLFFTIYRFWPICAGLNVIYYFLCFNHQFLCLFCLIWDNFDTSNTDSLGNQTTDSVNQWVWINGRSLIHWTTH